MTIEQKDKLNIYVIEEYMYGWMDAMLAMTMYNIRRSHDDINYNKKYINVDILPTSLTITLII